LNGNLTQKGTQHYIHDYRNRIVSATDGSSQVKFKYDALGRRTQKDVTIGSQSKTTNFYYAGHQAIEERDGSDHVIRQLIYGNGIDEVIRVDKYSGTTSTPYYFHRNEIGSTTAVTDANGNIIERVYYDIYGLPTFKKERGQSKNDNQRII
jgi:YD repeat-containing protein